MVYNIISIISISWLWLEIKPIQYYLITKNWYIAELLTCWKCSTLWFGIIYTTYFYLKTYNYSVEPSFQLLDPLIASFIVSQLEKINN